MGGLNAITYCAAIVSWHVCVTHRRVNVVHLFILGHGVVDPFLNAQDVLLVTEVPRGLPRDLDPPWRRQSAQVHPCGRLRPPHTHISSRTKNYNDNTAVDTN